MTETLSPAIGSAIPLFFTYRDCLFGNGFVVEVIAKNGRALCVRESDGFWMYGINPGAMAASGETPDEAHTEFRSIFSAVLKDLAHEAGSFDEFQALVTAFFNDTNPGHEREWFGAVEAVRSQKVDASGIPRVPAETPPEIVISMKQVFSADDNTANLELKEAA